MIEQVPATRLAVANVLVDIQQDQWGSWKLRVAHRRLGETWDRKNDVVNLRVEWCDVGTVAACRINKLLGHAAYEGTDQLELF